jgi:methionyl-tRNA formyltransferase
MGTPELARVCLVALANSPLWQVTGVVAQPDRPAGRGLQPQPPPVKTEALQRGLPVLQPERARDPAFLEQLRLWNPDVIVVAAYGQILPPDLLALPPRGCLNVHTSLLPRWRGAAPIHWALLAGDHETGVTLMRMDRGLDTGDILATVRTPIADTDTGQTLHDRLAQLGAQLLLDFLPGWLANRGYAPPQPQPVEGVTYARKLTREDGLLDWSRPAAELHRQVRALDPWPGAHTLIPTPEGSPLPLKIWSALPGPDPGIPGEVLSARGDDFLVATGQGSLRLLHVQPAGRRRMTAREFLAAQRLIPGTRLGGPPPTPPA